MLSSSNSAARVSGVIIPLPLHAAVSIYIPPLRQLQPQPRDHYFYRMDTMTMFPLEIEFLIINECRDDPGCLAACSLVCRAWHLASRAHLFREVVLKVTSRTRRHLVDLQHILDSSLNSIGDFVDELHLIGDNDDEDAEDASPLAKSLSLEMGVVSSLVRALPRLHTLVVRNLRVVRNGLRLSPDSRPAMRRVEITCVTTTPHSRGRADDLCTLLHLFSSIHTLELDISDGQPTPRAFYPDSISEGITAGPPVKITTLLFHRLIATWPRGMRISEPMRSNSR
ncbi:hypothetical protein OH76DRAFT_123488 [Lentinus brumalis]|uniref:F-box domain-containing protein n=1 Tax=Lentinus brumalis TaxID=2498619 RepID=A0A371DJP1_9APHY|nr:hypothetical protein OH76DRAFT_123488 [Polyporus brumalis]